MTPLIGITGRRLQASAIATADRRFASRLVDVYWSDFAYAVARAGAIPVHLPFEAALLDVTSRLDGLIITGGQDVSAEQGGAEASSEETRSDPRLHLMAPDPERDRYEVALVHAAIELIPLLGVCRGHQIINVALGGTLIPDLASEPQAHDLPGAAPNDAATSHAVRFVPGSLAASIYGPEARVNSWHHQAVGSPGVGLQVSGRAVDGTIEAIELHERPVLGVQWHPEWRPTADPAFAWLIAAARG